MANQKEAMNPCLCACEQSYTVKDGSQNIKTHGARHADGILPSTSTTSREDLNPPITRVGHGAENTDFVVMNGVRRLCLREINHSLVKEFPSERLARI